VPFVLVTALFFLWEFQQSEYVLIASHEVICISRFSAGLVQSAFYMGYFLWPCGRSSHEESGYKMIRDWLVTLRSRLLSVWPRPAAKLMILSGRAVRIASASHF